jgi:nucleotide sugar dehydrogenase
MAQHGSALIEVAPQVAPRLALGSPGAAGAGPAPTVAVVGLGYVGLPTSLAFVQAGSPVLGLEVSEHRLDSIRQGAVDLSAQDVVRLTVAVAGEELRLTTDASALRGADAVVICVPTPVDERRRPDTRALEAACATVVAHARPGQTLLLTSTTYVGTTRQLLVEPLADRGLLTGRDVFVAFAPERINPGDRSFEQAEVPRVVGGTTRACAAAALRVLAPTTERLHVVSSPEAAELTKLYENTFRAVNLAFANEMADVARHHGIDPLELVAAAATKPYGFLAHHPGPGVGGHCIPVDPHYLVAPLHEAGLAAPIAERALEAIDARPGVVAARALEILRQTAGEAPGARVLVVGMAYKPNVADARESPARAIAEALAQAGVRVDYHDPLVERVALAGGELRSVADPRPEDYDLAVVVTVHPGFEYRWLSGFGEVLDATYRTTGGRRRHLV